MNFDYIELLKKLINKKQAKIEQLQEELAELKEELKEKEDLQKLEDLGIEY